MRKLLALALGLAFAAAPFAPAETIQQGGVRVNFDGQIAPRRLPRSGSAPVSVTVATKISAIAAVRRRKASPGPPSHSPRRATRSRAARS